MDRVSCPLPGERYLGWDGFSQPHLSADILMRGQEERVLYVTRQCLLVKFVAPWRGAALRSSSRIDEGGKGANVHRGVSWVGAGASSRMRSHVCP